MSPAAWERRLTREGMPAELPSVFAELTGRFGIKAQGQRLERTVVRMHDHFAWEHVVRGYLERARWRQYPSRHRRVWQLYAAQVPQRQIASKVQLGLSGVNHIIHRHLDIALAR